MLLLSPKCQKLGFCIRSTLSYKKLFRSEIRFCFRTPSRSRIPLPLERFVPENRGAVHDPSVWEVIRHSVVLRDSVIPKRNVVLLPLPPQRELRLGRLREQEPKQRIALGFRHVHDPSQEALAHEQRLPPTHGVGANQGVDHGRVLLHGVLPEGRGVAAAGIVVTRCGKLLDEAVLCVEPEEELLQIVGLATRYECVCPLLRSLVLMPFDLASESKVPGIPS